MATLQPPDPPDPGDCCGSGCARCVWDVYYTALEAFEFQQAAKVASKTVTAQCARHQSCVSVTYYDSAEAVPVHPEDPEEFYKRKKMVQAPVTKAACLTCPSAQKEVIGLILDLQGSGLYYVPGDALRIHCPNAKAEVDPLLARLDLDVDRLLVVKPADPSSGRRAPCYPAWIPERPMTIHHLFSHYIDICAPLHTRLLRLLEQSTDNPTEKDTLHALLSSQEQFTQLAAERPSLLTLLMQFPACHPPLPLLLESCDQLRDRSYSVASAPLGWCRSVDLVFTVEQDVLPSGEMFRGHCSSWMKQCLGSPPQLTKIPIAAAPADRHQGFHLPSDLSVPLLLLATGTGIAPFRSFLQHRQYISKQRGNTTVIGPWFMYYGCRHPSKDYLFRDELEKCLADGTLKDLHVAFSQQEPRRYITQLLVDHHVLISQLMDQKAVVYICGSPAMVSDIESAFLKVLHMERIDDSAEDILNKWKAEERYRVDEWH